jgi:Tol biopolymer transport system component
MRRGSMIARLFFLFMAMNCCFFVVGASDIDNEEVLVLDNSLTMSHEVLILQVSSGKPVQKELAKQVSYFEITRSGHFIMKDLSQRWFKGSIDSSLNVTKQELKLVPRNITRALISEDGNRIAWVNTNPIKSNLVVDEYNGDQSKVLRIISDKGFISAPSWSPDGNMLAYYSGPPSAAARDGFSLMLLNVNSANNQPERIAPPSLPTRLTPIRPTPPLWSPDGKSIRFEARYDDDFFNRTYIVWVGNKQLMPVSFDIYDPDGERVYELNQEAPGLSRFLITESNILKEKQGKNLQIRHRLELPNGFRVVVLSSSAKRVAYFGKDWDVFIYDTTTERTISFGNYNSEGSFYWINPAKR